MAETDAHREQMIDLLNNLTEYFRDDSDIYVTGNIFLYLPPDEYLPNEPRQSVSPDIFVVQGIEKKPRRIYDMTVEKKAPDVIIELVSRSTRADDMGRKKFLYAEMGVAEYFIFDPLNEAFENQLHGFRLTEGRYVDLLGTRFSSKVLGLDLVIETGKLRLYNSETGERLRTHHESEADRRLAEERAAKAEAENARLLKELEALRSKKK